MAQPFALVDLSEKDPGKGVSQLNRFMLAYTGRDESLREVVIVDEKSVYKGDKNCVEKPRALKNLTQDQHLLRVKDALVEVARDAGDGRSGGGDSDGCGTEAKGRITLTLELEDDAEPGHARWTVKNTLKDRKTSVVLATATLPKVDDGGGLLMGIVRTAFVRGEESKRLRQHLGKADGERIKLKALLDKATTEKRRVIHGMMERVALVVNSKKAKISTLQEQESNEESGISDGEDGEDARDGEGTTSSAAGDNDDNDGDGIDVDGDDDDDSDAKGKQSSRKCMSKSKGKGKGVAIKQEAAVAGGKGGLEEVGKEVGDQVSIRTVSLGKAKRSKEGSGSTASRRRRDVGGDRVNLEEVAEDESGTSDGEMMRESGWGALAVPAGTQEVSGEDLLRHVEPVVDIPLLGTSSRKSACSLLPSSSGTNGKNKKRSRQHQHQRHYDQRPLPSAAQGDMYNDTDGGSHGGSSNRQNDDAFNETSALVGSHSDSDDGSGGGYVGDSGFDEGLRRRRKTRKIATVEKTGEALTGASVDGASKVETKSSVLGLHDVSTDDDWDEDQLT